MRSLGRVQRAIERVRKLKYKKAKTAERLQEKLKGATQRAMCECYKAEERLREEAAALGRAQERNVEYRERLLDELQELEKE